MSDDGHKPLSEETHYLNLELKSVVQIPDSVRDIYLMLCGCVPRRAVFEEVAEYLRSVKKGDGDFLASGDNFGARYLVASVCDHVGMTGHGTSIRGSWLTEEGEESLEFLEEYADSSAFGDYFANNDDYKGWIEECNLHVIDEVNDE